MIYGGIFYSSNFELVGVEGKNSFFGAVNWFDGVNIALFDGLVNIF